MTTGDRDLPLHPSCDLPVCSPSQMEGGAPAWAWSGIAVFASLSALNAFWFVKIVRLACGGRSYGNKKGVIPAGTSGELPAKRVYSGGKTQQCRGGDVTFAVMCGSVGSVKAVNSA